jgi:hypothetical protein
MAKKEDDKVTSLVARRTQQRKQRGEVVHKDDPIMKAADEITELYGRIGARMSAEDLLVAIYLGERALYTVLRRAVGKGHTDIIRQQAIQRACKEYALHDEHAPDTTVFDKDTGDDEPPKPTG